MFCSIDKRRNKNKPLNYKNQKHYKTKERMFDIETLPWLAAKAIRVDSNMTMKDAGMVVLFGINKF